jgi:hypothetical protein
LVFVLVISRVGSFPALVFWLLETKIEF